MVFGGKKFNGAPFGSQSSRFHSMEAIELQRATWMEMMMDPSLNDLPFVQALGRNRPPRMESHAINEARRVARETCEVEGKQKKSYGIWHSLNTGEAGMLPPFRLRKIFSDKEEQKRLRGPGTYNTRSWSEEQRPGCSRGMMSTHTPRFKKPPKHLTGGVGPGSYTGDILMYNMPKMTFSNLVPMNSCGPGHNFPPRHMVSDNTLGPGTYDLIAPMDKLKNDMKRGPIELYTQPRDKVYGVDLKRLPILTMDPTLYNLPVPPESLSTRHRQRTGCFYKAPRFPNYTGSRHIMVNRSMWCNEETVGPSTYDLQTLTKPQNAKKLPFNRTARRKSPPKLPMIVPPARYYPDNFTRKNINAHTNTFKLSNRMPGLAAAKQLQERLRGKDLHPREKFDHSAQR